MRLVLRAARRAALAASVLAAACTDVPFAPKWDADWTVPLPLTPINLRQTFGQVSSVPPSFSATIPDTVLVQHLDQSIGQLLRQGVRRAILRLNYVMTLALAGDDTVYVAASPADLANPAAVRIAFPIALAQTGAAGADVVDTLAAGSPQLAMLESAASSGGSGALYVEVRGTVRNPSATQAVPITPTDEIGLGFQLTVRIPISK